MEKSLWLRAGKVLCLHWFPPNKEDAASLTGWRDKTTPTVPLNPHGFERKIQKCQDKRKCLHTLKQKKAHTVFVVVPY